MKQLCLIRHARANLQKANESDLDRNLSNEGEKDALWLGSVIKNKGIYPDQIVSSSAKRAMRTAEIISEAINYPIESIYPAQEVYDSEVENLIRVIRGFNDGHQLVFLVGHNPSISMVVTYLTKHSFGNMAAAGLFSCKFHIDSWQAVSKDSGIFDFVLEPG